MIISIFTRDIKLTCIYKYVMLQEQLNDLGACLNIFVVREFYDFFQNIISEHEKIKEYYHYCSQLKNLKIIPCDHNDHLSQSQLLKDPIMESGILNSDLILFNIDRRLMISLPRIKEFINKIVGYKFRSCNDLRYYDYFKLWIPSCTYDNHNHIRYIGIKNKSNLIEYVSPFETGDVSNSFLKLNKDFIQNKYSLDPKKKTLLYYISPWASAKSSTQEEKILNKLLNNILKEYNVLLLQKPYFSFSLKEHEKFNIDFFDYDYLMRNEVSCIVGGISTAIRESLIYEIPVLCMYRDQFKINFRKDIKSMTRHLSDRFGINIRMYDQFNGMFANVNSNWVKRFNLIENKKYDYSKKREMWFGNKSLLNKLKETILK